MNKYLEQIAELQKEAMKPLKVVDAARKAGKDVGEIRMKMTKKMYEPGTSRERFKKLNDNRELVAHANLKRVFEGK